MTQKDKQISEEGLHATLHKLIIRRNMELDRILINDRNRTGSVPCYLCRRWTKLFKSRQVRVYGHRDDCGT